MNKFIIGSGYSPSSRYDYQAFAPIWLKQIRKQYPDTQVYVMEQGERLPHTVRLEPNVNVIPTDNLGHVHTLIDNHRAGIATHQLCGWSASILALAMIAYNAKADAVYIEQDCLIFGDVIGQAYRDLGNDGRMVFGSCKIMGVAQSLFLIRHDYIPTFVQYYVALWSDTHPQLRPEDKFKKIEQTEGPKVIKRLSFGLDRDRPINYECPLYYVQQLTEAELAEYHRRNLL